MREAPVDATRVALPHERIEPIPLKEGTMSFMRGLLGAPTDMLSVVGDVAEYGKEHGSTVFGQPMPLLALLGAASPVVTPVSREYRDFTDRVLGVNPDTLSSQAKTLYNVGLGAGMLLPLSLPGRPAALPEELRRRLQRRLDDELRAVGERRPPTPPLNAAEENAIRRELDIPESWDDAVSETIEQGPTIPRLPWEDQYSVTLDDLLRLERKERHAGAADDVSQRLVGGEPVEPTEDELRSWLENWLKTPEGQATARPPAVPPKKPINPDAMRNMLDDMFGGRPPLEPGQGALPPSSRINPAMMGSGEATGPHTPNQILGIRVFGSNVGEVIRELEAGRGVPIGRSNTTISPPRLRPRKAAPRSSQMSILKHGMRPTIC